MTTVIDPSREAVAERQRSIRLQRAFLQAVSDGTAYKVVKAIHRGCTIEIVTALRPDGRTQISAQTVDKRGKGHTFFSITDSAAGAQVVAQALRELCSAIEKFEKPVA